MARHIEQSQSLDVTVAGMAMGTPLYMSPEQANGETEVSPASDVYSLGVTLFYVLTGRPPFQANSIPALIGMHASQAAPSPLDFNPDLNAAVAQVVLKTMAKSTAARYADAEQFLGDLRERLSGLHAEMTRLADTWRDQEQEKFTQEFQQTLQVVEKFLEISDQHVPFLQRKAERIEEYLQQR